MPCISSYQAWVVSGQSLGSHKWKQVLGNQIIYPAHRIKRRVPKCAKTLRSILPSSIWTVSLLANSKTSSTKKPELKPFWGFDCHTQNTTWWLCSPAKPEDPDSRVRATRRLLTRSGLEKGRFKRIKTTWRVWNESLLGLQWAFKIIYKIHCFHTSFTLQLVSSIHLQGKFR